jgi:hypothetical protein
MDQNLIPGVFGPVVDILICVYWCESQMTWQPSLQFLVSQLKTSVLRIVPGVHSTADPCQLLFAVDTSRCTYRRPLPTDNDKLRLK